jgi:hypothetical protein
MISMRLENNCLIMTFTTKLELQIIERIKKKNLTSLWKKFKSGQKRKISIGIKKTLKIMVKNSKMLYIQKLIEKNTLLIAKSPTMKITVPLIILHFKDQQEKEQVIMSSDKR